MSMLATLKLVASKREKEQNPTLHRRRKLSHKVHEQIQLAQAQKEGSTYAPVEIKTVTNRITGERQSVEKTKRIKEWWFTNDSGRINLLIKYGSKALNLDAKGTKNAIEIGNSEELISALKTIKSAIELGELDAQIEAASSSIRARFAK